ncbi:MAG: cardiolipin synthase [Deltaproteobacteria bacterium]|nr:cardiolipin synthase [Deltaproteobacteria bacterium]
MPAWNVLSLILEHLGNVLAFVLVLAILSGKKEARATLGWVLLVLFLPYFGTFAYLLFGRIPPRVSRRKGADRARGVQFPPELPPPMARTTHVVGIPPLRCRNLEFLPSAAVKYARLFQDIERAKKRVVLCYYVFRRDATGRSLLELLARKASEGVEVYLLYDGWGAFWLRFGGFLKPYLSLGLRARPFHPVVDPLQMSRINFRNHRKIVVVDGSIGYTGSINIGDEYLGRHLRFGAWKDVHVRFEGEAAAALETVFRADWGSAGGAPLLEELPFGDPGDTWLHVIPSGPNQAEESLFPLLLAQLAAAERRVDIMTPYLVPDHSLITALAVASRQGAEVRVLVPGRSNHPMVAAAGRSYYEELLSEGVCLYETTEGMLHGKGILIDDRWAMVGSTNLDDRSLHLNFEVNVATSDPTFCSELRETFGGWLAEARLVRLEDVTGRPLVRRFLEGACRTLSPVL